MSHSMQPITAQDLRAQLQTGIVHFYFVKTAGALREVRGTTNLRHIPADHHPTSGRTSPPSVVTFWDLLAGGWRSANVNSAMFIANN